MTCVRPSSKLTQGSTNLRRSRNGRKRRNQSASAKNARKWTRKALMSTRLRTGSSLILRRSSTNKNSKITLKSNESKEMRLKTKCSKKVTGLPRSSS